MSIVYGVYLLPHALFIRSAAISFGARAVLPKPLAGIPIVVIDLRRGDGPSSFTREGEAMRGRIHLEVKGWAIFLTPSPAQTRRPA